MNKKEVYAKILVDFLIALTVVLLFIFFLPKVLSFFLPFVIGWVIAMIANPLVRFLERNVKIVRKHSSALIIIGVLAAIVCILYFGGSFLVRQVIGLSKDLPAILTELQVQMELIALKLDKVLAFLPEEAQQFFDSIGNGIMSYIGEAISNTDGITVGTAGSLVKNVAEGFLMSIITVLSAYFFIADRDNLIRGIKNITPESIQSRVSIVKENFARAIGGYFKAQFKIMLVVVVILFAGFEILDVHYSFLLALVVAFLDFLPVFGTGTVIFPWVIIDLVSGQYFHAVGLTMIYLICQVVRQLLQPKMVGDSIGLSPLSTLFFMFVGYKLKGVLGMIIGIPIGMAVINLYKAGLFDKLIKGLKIMIHDINEFRQY